MYADADIIRDELPSWRATALAAAPATGPAGALSVHSNPTASPVLPATGTGPVAGVAQVLLRNALGQPVLAPPAGRHTSPHTLALP